MMVSLRRRVEKLEREAGVCSVSTLVGFALADETAVEARARVIRESGLTKECQVILFVPEADE